MKREWLCSLVLRLYPASFRTQYGREMTDTIRDLRHESSASAWRFWLFIGADACRAAFDQQVDAWRGRSRVALSWIAACTLGAAAWKAIATIIAWLFTYLYHPYLEGTTLNPWVYGATLGAGLGAVQCLVVRQLPRPAWIVVSAACAAVGFEMAMFSGSLTGPIGFGCVIGLTVACGQWMVLRERVYRASLLAAVGGVVLSVTAISLGVAANRAPLAVHALDHYATVVDRTPAVPLQVVYAPMDWNEWTLGVIAVAISGLVIGAITAKPVAALVSDAH
jgi:hypothetical protein